VAKDTPIWTSSGVHINIKLLVCIECRTNRGHCPFAAKQLICFGYSLNLRQYKNGIYFFRQATARLRQIYLHKHFTK